MALRVAAALDSNALRLFVTGDRKALTVLKKSSVVQYEEARIAKSEPRARYKRAGWVCGASARGDRARALQTCAAGVGDLAGGFSLPPGDVENAHGAVFAQQIVCPDQIAIFV